MTEKINTFKGDKVKAELSYTTNVFGQPQYQIWLYKNNASVLDDPVTHKEVNFSSTRDKIRSMFFTDKTFQELRFEKAERLAKGMVRKFDKQLKQMEDFAEEKRG